MNEIYNQYSTYLKGIYGEKVYKLPINLPGTCPNRDGKLSTGGCYFCSEKGAGFESLSSTLDVASQLNENMAYIGKRYNAKKFIAYFQNYTNTYMALASFKKAMEAACIENIVELDIATRPDCIEKEHLDILLEVQRTYNVEIVLELGLQTTNEISLKRINRGHDVQAFIDAVKKVKAYGFKVCTHLIINLPWDDDSEVLRMAALMNALNIDMVKCHSLYIAKDTVFADLYISGDLMMNTLDNYTDRMVVFLTHLHPKCAVQRLVGRAPKDDTVFCNWGVSWWKIKDQIIEKMLKDNLWQGKMME
jgi:radical SAM protein (TIGR01212 family)